MQKYETYKKQGEIAKLELRCSKLEAKAQGEQAAAEMWEQKYNVYQQEKKIRNLTLKCSKLEAKANAKQAEAKMWEQNTKGPCAVARSHKHCPIGRQPESSLNAHGKR